MGLLSNTLNIGTLSSARSLVQTKKMQSLFSASKVSMVEMKTLNISHFSSLSSKFKSLVRCRTRSVSLPSLKSVAEVGALSIGRR